MEVVNLEQVVTSKNYNILFEKLWYTDRHTIAQIMIFVGGSLFVRIFVSELIIE